MTETSNQPIRPRTDLVPADALLGIVSERTDFVGSDSLAAWNHQPLPIAETFGRLPTELTADEISRLGLRISDMVEQMNPSRDGFSNGRAAETMATYLIGRNSLFTGDITTALSSAVRLRELGGLLNNFRAFRIERLLARSRK